MYMYMYSTNCTYLGTVPVRISITAPHLPCATPLQRDALGNLASSFSMSNQLMLTVPSNGVAGQEMTFMTPSGQQMMVTIPVGVPPGSSFVFEAPAMLQGSGLPTGSFIDTHEVPMAGRPTPARQFAECPISFEPLHTAPVGFFVAEAGFFGSKRRVSQHYFNLNAAREWLATGNGRCPLTRKPIASVVEVPSIRHDPNAWFDAVDVDHNNRLTRHETIEALKAQFPVDVASLDAAITNPDHWMWERWDVNRDGTITRDELLAPNGLVASVPELFAPRSTAPNGSDTPPISDKAAWFDFWDSPLTGGNSSGTLEKEEVVRALLKTLGTTGDANAVMAMRSTVLSVWGIFDMDGSGSVERGEFLARDGLADTIIATLAL